MRKEVELPKVKRATKTELKQYAKQLLEQGYTGSILEKMAK